MARDRDKTEAFADISEMRHAAQSDYIDRGKTCQHKPRRVETKRDAPKELHKTSQSKKKHNEFSNIYQSLSCPFYNNRDNTVVFLQTNLYVWQYVNNRKFVIRLAYNIQKAV